jgi:hypothetical protein
MAGERGGRTNIGDGLRSPPAERRLAAMAELAARALPPAEDEMDALIDCLRDERKLVQRRAAETVATLARRGWSAEEKVRSLLRSHAWRDRWGAVYALSLMGELGLEGIETLAESLGSEDRDLRWAGLDLLKKLAERRREAVVGQAVDLGRGGTPTQRRLAFYLLRHLGACGDDAIAAAAEALATEDASLRLAALAALAAGSPASPDVARITALVSDPDLRVARAAAAMLGSLGNKGSQVLEALRRARLAADASLRKAASSSLRRLDADDSVE